LTAAPEDRRVRLARAAVIAAALAPATGALAATPGIGGLPSGWTHAEVNVTIRGVPHTIIWDRGRVTAFSGSEILLRERDGSAVTIPVSGSTIVRVDGRPGSLADIHRGEAALTMRIDGGAARRVRVHVLLRG